MQGRTEQDQKSKKLFDIPNLYLDELKANIELLSLTKAMCVSLSEMNKELERKDYRLLPKVVTPQMDRDFTTFSEKIGSFLKTKDISTFHPFLFFYMSEMHIQHQLIDALIQLFILIFKTLTKYTKPCTFLILKNTLDLIVMFNGPTLQKGKEYSFQDLTSYPDYLKKAIIVSNDFEIYHSLGDFIDDRRNKDKDFNDERFLVQNHLDAAMIKTFIKNHEKMRTEAKAYYREMMLKIEFEKFTLPPVLAHNQPKTDALQVTFSKEIKAYEKLSPITRHKKLVALQRDLKSINHEMVKTRLQNYENFVKQYIEESIKVFKNDTSNDEKSYTIIELQRLYDIFLKNGNIEEKSKILKKLQHIESEFNPRLRESLQQLQTAILSAEHQSEQELKKAKIVFAAKHEEIFSKLTKLNNLYKEAQIKQNKKLQQHTIFTKKESIKRFFDQLDRHIKIIDKSTQTEIEIIKQHTALLDTEFKKIDDKISKLEWILQPTPRKKNPPKAAKIKKPEPSQKYEFNIPEVKSNVVEILENIEEEKDLEIARVELMMTNTFVFPNTQQTVCTLKQVGLFRSTSLSEESKKISTAYSSHSYGLLILCKNNRYLRSFAAKITDIIPTFRPNKELLSQPHISLFFVQDIKLDNTQTRESIQKDLKHIFDDLAITEQFSFDKVAVFGHESNKNKFLSLEITPDDSLNQIFERCKQVFLKHGIPIPKKYDFKPHITLGYSWEPIDPLINIEMSLAQPYVELDVSILNRKPLEVPGTPKHLISTETLETFTLKFNSQKLKLNT